MGLISRTYAAATVSNAEIKSEHWADLDTIYTEFNANIDNANIKAAAAIAASKLDLTDIATAVRFNNGIELQFENAAGTAEGKIGMSSGDEFRITGGTVTASYNTTQFIGSAGRNGRIEINSDGNDKALHFYHNDTDSHIESDAGLLVLTTAGANDIVIDLANNANAALRPAEDDVNDFGAAGSRWETIYAGNGTINTSDKREKKDIEDSDLGLDFIKKLRPVSFRKKKVAKGKKDIKHYGLIAQEVEKLLPEETIYSYNKEVDHYGIYYSELIGPVVKAIQELEEKVSELTA